MAKLRLEAKEEIVISVRLHVIVLIILAATVLNAVILALTILSVKSNLENVFEAKTNYLENKILRIEEAYQDPSSRKINTSSGMNTPSMLHHYQDTNTQNFIQTREKRGGKPLLDQLQGLHLVPVLDSFQSKTGRIYYWYQTNDTLRKSHQLREGAEFEFLDNRSKIQIHKGGLYLVYAQVSFDTSGAETTHYSIRIKQGGKGSKNARKATECAIVAPNYPDLVDQSCFTSTVTSLSAGDQVFLQLQDLHRRVNANEGKTFWGLLRLN